MSAPISLHTNLFPSIGFIQLQVALGDPTKNVRRILEELSKVQPDLHSLVILPELWAMGPFYRKMDKYADQTDELLERLSEIASTYSIILGGTLPEKVERNGEVTLFNTFYFIGGDQIYGKIRKQYLIPTNYEDKWFSAGGYQKTVTTPFGTIGGCVCNDIRFPDVVSDLCQQGSHVFTVAAQWPKSNIDQWCTLLKARAIENQTFLVACNVVGACNGMQFGGNSIVIDPTGKILLNANHDEGAYFIPVNWRMQEDVRKNFNTVAMQRGPINYCDKIVTSDECIVNVTRRTLTGQKVICAHLKWKCLGDNLIDYLQKIRKSGDFLVILSNPSLSSSNLSHLAALDCVDMVVNVNEDCLALLDKMADKIVYWSE